MSHQTQNSNALNLHENGKRIPYYLALNLSKDLTGISAFSTGGAYRGSPGSAKWLTNCAIPGKGKI